jgi:branched-chain amino acid transport system ATP-binding protein
METLEELAGDGQTIVLVEQHINRTLSLVDRGYFIENGRIVADGTAEELEDDELQQQYLTV